MGGDVVGAAPVTAVCTFCCSAGFAFARAAGGVCYRHQAMAACAVDEAMAEGIHKCKDIAPVPIIFNARLLGCS